MNPEKGFTGLAFFDPFARLLLFAFIFFGVLYASSDLFAAAGFATLFDLLVLLFSAKEDSALLDYCKSVLETGR